MARTTRADRRGNISSGGSAGRGAGRTQERRSSDTFLSDLCPVRWRWNWGFCALARAAKMENLGPGSSPRSGDGMADMRVLEALAVRRAGSSPVPSTSQDYRSKNANGAVSFGNISFSPGGMAGSVGNTVIVAPNTTVSIPVQVQVTVVPPAQGQTRVTGQISYQGGAGGNGSASAYAEKTAAKKEDEPPAPPPVES
jgi:hypothetical protein